jgi:D-alanyl-D-alanine carboxypeptidase
MMFLLQMFDRVRCTRLIAGRYVAPVTLLLPILLFAACSRPGGYGYSEYGPAPYSGAGTGPSFAPTHYYPPPGPPEDPWGPYIREAAARYNVPEQWVRAVMQQESGGEEQAVSPVGAMGLMQVMPTTYEGLRERYGLGDDPFDPHNNILAGTAYIREMYDQFGAPGFLAGYNAGPDRVNSYLAGTAILPDETVNYLAAVTPNLGNAVPLSGPLATYASARAGVAAAAYPGVTSLAAGCDLNAAYNPAHPCTSLMQAATTPAPVQQASLPQTGIGGCDLSAAYDPAHPCTSVVATAPVVAAYAPQPAVVQQAAIGCGLNAAYNPNHPCTTAGQQVAAAAPVKPMIEQAQGGGCDVNAAYDPERPCRPVPPPAPAVQLASAEGCGRNGEFNLDDPCREAALADGRALFPTIKARPISSQTSLAGVRPAGAPSYRPVEVVGAATSGAQVLRIPTRDWGIQVGAFASPALARAVAEAARAQAPGQLRSAAITLPPVSGGGSVLYRARLVNLSASGAANACTNLNRRQLPCVVVQPSHT